MDMLIKKKLCRTCDYEDATSMLVSLRSELIPGVLLADALMACAPIEVGESDGLPYHICDKCLDSLYKAYTFQMQCVQIQKKLKQILTSEEVHDADTQLQLKQEVKEEDCKNETDNFFDQNEDFKIQSVLNDALDNNIQHFKCFNCHQGFRDKEEFLNHVQIHGDREFTCDICGYIFHKITSFSRHLLSHSKREKSYKCSIETLLKHTALGDITTDVKIKDEPEDEHRCLECGKNFKKEKTLLCHMKKHKVPDSKVFQCEHCFIRCSTKRLLRQHIKKHQYLPYKCSKCDKSYLTEELLSKHTIRHEKPKTKQCPHCDKTFSQVCNLKDHIRTHTKETPFLCSHCGKSFNSRSNLRQHMLRHTNFKPFSCNRCPKSFHTKGQLLSHIKVHTGEHPYVCDICGSAFTTPSSLKKHKLIHTGDRQYECEVCERKFLLLYHLKRHFRIHTGEKPYKCKICTRAFTQSNDLIKHMRRHVGPNVYKCKMCKTGFRLMSELKQHYPIHFADKSARELLSDYETETSKAFPPAPVTSEEPPHPGDADADTLEPPHPEDVDADTPDRAVGCVDTVSAALEIPVDVSKTAILSNPNIQVKFN